MNSTKTNWLKFTSLLSKSVINTLEPLTDTSRVNAFVVDDSLFERTGCRKTELASKVFDHASMRYTKGYRLMTLGWTDGNTFIPVNNALLASAKKHNIIGAQNEYDGRSLAGRRRKLAQMKGTDAMLELIRSAQSAGHKADYVLFESICAVFHVTDEQICEFTSTFVEKLPIYIRNALIRNCIVA